MVNQTTLFNKVIPIAKRAFKQTVTSLVLCTLAFAVYEPVVSYGANATNTFVVRLGVSDEISFLTAGTTTTMVGSIAGITGGAATGTTQVVIYSTSFTGYTMDIAFSGAPAMRGLVTNDTGIRDYASTTAPSYTFISSTSAQFAYSITAASSSDVAQSFLNNGTACNAGVTSTFARCWAGPTTVNKRIINRITSTGADGATTTITFRLEVPSNPVPTVVADTYQATATLTATNQ